MGGSDSDLRVRSWALRGDARQVAAFVGVALLAGTVLALLIDVLAADTADAGTVQGWTLIPQALAAAGLIYTGRRAPAKSFLLIGGLIVAILIEEAFHVTNPTAVWLADRAAEVSEWTGIRFGFLMIGFIYGAMAVVGLGVIYYAYRGATRAEQRVIRNLTLLLIVGGLFGGPIGAIGFLGHARLWILIEEFGEALVFVAIAAYVAGLVALTRVRRVPPR